VASSLLGVVAQRLVRKVCENCVEAYQPTDQEKVWLSGFNLDPLDLEAGFVHGKGCYQCSNSGYRGRLGVYEMLEMNEPMLDALRRQDISLFTREARKSSLYRPLGHCAMDFALRGVTTLEEVSRVAATSEGEVSLEEVPELSDEISGEHPAPGGGN
jgi:MSHA biogenesis protein MshE